MLGRFSPRLGHSLQSEAPWGLRPASFTQCFQEGVTEPWPSLIWREKKEGQMDLDLEQGKGGSKEGERLIENTSFCGTGFLASLQGAPQHSRSFWAVALSCPGLWSCHLFHRPVCNIRVDCSHHWAP